MTCYDYSPTAVAAVLAGPHADALRIDPGWWRNATEAMHGEFVREESERIALGLRLATAEARIATLEAALRELQIAIGESLRCADVLIRGLEHGAGGTVAERVEQATRALRSEAVRAALGGS